jgi:predicted DNA-binding transcriptional regulator AlpA
MKWLRYPDLVGLGIFNSRMTLKRAIDSQGFPPGRLLTANARVWSSDEIDEWISTRPTARKPSTRKATPQPNAPIAA